MTNNDEQTYAGTDILKMLCYGCQDVIEDLDDAWDDIDEAVIVCTKCKDQALVDYPDSTFVPAKDYIS